MIFAALAEAADRGELLLLAGGMCRFHLRRDGIVTIREILVLPSHRGLGLGRTMVEEVQRRHPGATLRATCPADYPSNGFWRHLGFFLVHEGDTNLWQRPASSTVLTETRPLPLRP